MSKNESNSANNSDMAPAAAPNAPEPAPEVVAAAKSATASATAASEAESQAVAAASAATEAQNQARTLAAGAAAAYVAKAAVEAAAEIASKLTKLKPIPETQEKKQTKIEWIKETFTKKRDDKILGWFAGSSSGVITLKEWMDWLKNSALYGFILKYSIINAPSSDYDLPTKWVIAGKWGIQLVGLFLAVQFVALILLSFNQLGQKHWFLKIVALLILGLVILGMFYGMVFYFQSNKG